MNFWRFFRWSLTIGMIIFGCYMAWRFFSKLPMVKNTTQHQEAVLVIRNDCPIGRDRIHQWSYVPTTGNQFYCQFCLTMVRQ